MSDTPKGPHTPGLIGNNPHRVLLDERGTVVPDNKILRLKPEHLDKTITIPEGVEYVAVPRWIARPTRRKKAAVRGKA